MLKKSLLAAFIATALFQTSARAGGKSVIPLSVDRWSNGTIQFRGSLGSVRNSTKPVESIGCSASASIHSAPFATCYATEYSPQGTAEVACYTDNPGLVATIRALSPDSYVDVTIDARGYCEAVYILTQSDLEPKKP